MNRVVNQRYTLLRSLGRGGMGEVFLAADRERPGALVALKYLAGRAAGPDAGGLRDEFLRTSRLQHPHLVQVFDLETDRERGDSFISMEYVEGVDFQAACRDQPLSQLVELTLQACQALDYLHSQGVVHCDLKPENLLVSPAATPDAPPRLRMLDFGLSGDAHPGAAPIGDAGLAGTPAYMAPERFRGEWVDHRADLYSLGVLLYEVLAGRLPFESADAADLIRAHLEEEPAPPGRWRAGINPAVEAIVLRLLRKRPAERYQSARQVMEALAQFAAATPDTAGAPPLRPLAPRLVGRERVLAAMERLVTGLIGVEPPEEPLRLVLCGPPGSGKSRLAEEARLLARSRGVEVVWPDGAGASVSPFDLLRRLQVSLGAARRRFPEAGEPAQPTSDSGALAAVSPWPQLVELTRHTPVLIVLEDLHGADADSLLALSRLLRRGDGGRVAFLATSRQPLQTHYTALAQAWALGEESHQESLEPLTDEQVSLLLGSMFGVAHGAAAPEPLLRRSAGNPRFAVEWAQTLARRGVLEARDGGWRLDADALASIPAPPELVELASLRIRDLSPPASKLLIALAAFDRPVPAADAVAVAQIDPDLAAGALRELEERGVLAEPGERGPQEGRAEPVDAAAMALAHTALRDAALAMAGDGVRAVHARSATHIEAAGGASGAEMARRWRQAGEPARLKEHALRAADEAAAAGAVELELKLCEWALEATPEEARAERLRLLRRIAAILHAMEIWERAVQAHRRVQSSARALGDQGALLDALLNEHTRHIHALKLDEATAIKDAIRREFPVFPSPHFEAKFERDLGQRCTSENDPEQSRHHLQRAASLYRQSGRPVEAALCLINLAAYMIWTHSPDVTEPLFLESEAILRECGAEEWNYLPRLNLMEVARQRGHWAEAERRALEGLDDPRVCRKPRLVAKILTMLAEIRERGGSPDRALENFEQAAELARREGLDNERLHALEYQGALLRRLGLHERAAQIHSQALALAHRLRLSSQKAYQAAALAEDLCATGDGARAADLAREAYSEAERAGHGRAQVRALLAACRAALLLADEAAAADALNRIRARVDGSFQHAESACLEILATRLHLTRSQRQEARAALERGLNHARLGSLLAEEAEILALRIDAQLSPEPSADAARLREAVDALTRNASDTTVIRLVRQAPAWGSVLQRTGVPDAPGVSTGTDPRLSERRTLRALAEMGSIIETLEDPRRLASSVLECARELVGAERALLVLTAPDGGGAVTAAAASGLPPESEPEALAFSREALARGLESPLLILDAGADPRLASSLSVERFGIRSVLCVPLRLRGTLLGAVYLDSRTRVLEAGADHLRFLEAFAQQMAAALDAGRLLGALRSERERLRNRASERYRFHALLGRSPAMQEVYDLLEPFSKSDLPVLITGESGTGKELVARALHWNGPRREGPFVAENCAAIPQALLESELFGHVRGAFTGAEQDRRGVFAEASGGTLLLDEIGEMNPHLQAKLLRALQEKEVRPLGATRPISVNVRVVAATHRDLAAAVRDGRFREDLLYRLRVLALRLPPLRERLEDLPLLARHFLAEHRREHGRGPTDLSPQLVERLTRHPWMGNVRELRSEVLKLALVADGDRVEVRDLESHADLFGSILRPGRTGSRPRAGTLRDVERHEVERAVRTAHGDKQKAAALLGLSRATLYRKLRRYRIPAPPGN